MSIDLGPWEGHTEENYKKLVAVTQERDREARRVLYSSWDRPALEEALFQLDYWLQAFGTPVGAAYEAASATREECCQALDKEEG